MEWGGRSFAPAAPHNMNLPRYILLDKAVGETPLQCAENWRHAAGLSPDIPLAYAGRLDPLASGQLLVLIGEECKQQTNYHGLDKAYDFSILLGITSDSQDVMGRLRTTTTPPLTHDDITRSIQSFTGDIELPYPIFSAKTVNGKPLHTWAIEGRLHEIEIPTKHSTVYSLTFTKSETLTKVDVVEKALAKINSIPPVTELRKAIGNDFRRDDIRADWDNILTDDSLPTEYQIIHFTCIASSGTYMRTLASEIAKALGTVGLAWHIHRSEIGRYDSQSTTWTSRF